MNDLLLITLIIVTGGPLSFALARIAIRLHQAPGLAALTSVLIFWQMTALWDGGAELASAVMLLISVSALLILIQWLRSAAALAGLAHWALLILAGSGFALAATWPLLNPAQALIFCVGYVVPAGAARCAIRWARSPVQWGQSGLPAYGLMGLWLAVRIAASLIAALP